MKLVLIGYMGSGKSTLATRLAQEWNLPLLDLDQELEQKLEASIPEIMQEKGEIYFRKQERQMLEKLLIKEKYVLSTGGGTPCYYDNIDLINSQATSVYLSSSVKVLVQRLEKERLSRPLLAHLEASELPEFVAKHLFERAHFYQQAHLTIPSTRPGVEDQINFLGENL